MTLDNRHSGQLSEEDLMLNSIIIPAVFFLALVAAYAVVGEARGGPKIISR